MTLSPITCGLNDNPGDACYAEVTVAIDAEFEGVQLEVKTGNYFGSNTIIRNSTYENVIDRAGTFWSRQKFFFEVAEKTHWYAYLKLEDKVIWPRFVEVSYILPTHCEGVKYTIDSIRPTDDLNCDELVRADFDSCTEIRGNITTCGWYPTTGYLMLTTDSYAGKHALSSRGRASYTEGMVQYFDNRCMVLNNQYTLIAKYQLKDASGNIIMCDPSANLGYNACPRASIRVFFNGRTALYQMSFAKSLVPISSYDWNTIYGSFLIDNDIFDAEVVGVQIDGADPGLIITIDNVSITPYEHVDLQTDPPGGCVQNWDFEIGDSRHWKCKGEVDDCSLNIVHPGHNGSNYALSTKRLEEGWFGIAQLLDMDCFTEATRYEVNAWMKIAEYNGTLTDCDPYNFFFGLPTFCPNILIQDPDNDRSRFKIRSAAIAGPYDKDVWNHIYGVMTIRDVMLTWPSIMIYIGWIGANLNIIIDEISIKLVDTNTYGLIDCDQLVRNGDAEIGDSRFWFIRGTGKGTYGEVVIVDGDVENDSKYFYHKGLRTEMRHGLWQELEKSCMPVNTYWKISARMRLLDFNGNGMDCNKVCKR